MSDFPKEYRIPLHAALHELDTIDQTFGYRQANPNICGFCCLEGTCAFVNEDHICRHPSSKWKKVFLELKETKK